ncbi:MAG: hypothetical protein KJ069_29010 [Anaerolineae bacterium]|nr:hypothetical protein [Anaerolineae bacterium]
MGYQTAYDLVIAQLHSQHPTGQPLSFEPQLVAAAPDVGQVILAQFREGNEDAALAFDEDGSSLNFLNWDEFESDMTALSRQHPEYIFVLDGEGEEGGDMWRMYFHNGQVQLCPAIIRYLPFDPTAMGLPANQSGVPESGKHCFLITYNDSGKENHLFVTTSDGELSKASAIRYLAQEWDMEVGEMRAGDIQVIGPVFVDHLECIA